MPRWTLEARRKQAALIRTWKPWTSSTGPRTDAGKAVSAMNNYRHGWYTAGEGKEMTAGWVIFDRRMRIVIRRIKRARRKRESDRYSYWR